MGRCGARGEGGTDERSTGCKRQMRHSRGELQQHSMVVEDAGYEISQLHRFDIGSLAAAIAVKKLELVFVHFRRNGLG